MKSYGKSMKDKALDKKHTSMKVFTVRQFLRDIRSLFPIPKEGILVTRRDGNFYVYGQEMVHPKYKQKVKKCQWDKILEGGVCSSEETRRYLIKYTRYRDGLIFLCDHHAEAVKQSKIYPLAYL